MNIGRFLWLDRERIDALNRSGIDVSDVIRSCWFYFIFASSFFILALGPFIGPASIFMSLATILVIRIFTRRMTQLIHVEDLDEEVSYFAMTSARIMAGFGIPGAVFSFLQIMALPLNRNVLRENVFRRYAVVFRYAGEGLDRLMEVYAPALARVIKNYEESGSLWFIDSLHFVVDRMLRDRKFRLEKRVKTMSSRLSFFLIIFMMPTLFVFLVGPSLRYVFEVLRTILP